MAIQVGEMIAVKTEDLTAEDIKQIEIALVNTAATFTTFDNYMYSYLIQEGE